MNIFPSQARILLAITLGLLCALGTWQLMRLEWKNSIITQIDSKIHMEPSRIAIEISEADAYTPVKLKGHFVENKDIFLYDSRIYHGKTGFSLFSAFKLEDGRIVMIERGFVENKKSYSTNNTTDASGLILFPTKPSFFTPRNNLQQNIWFNIDLKEASEFLGLKLERFYVKMSGKSNNFPIRSELAPNITNNHFGYALTWFSLAIILLIIFILKNRNV